MEKLSSGLGAARRPKASFQHLLQLRKIDKIVIS
jgi:hypothetical protein